MKQIALLLVLAAVLLAGAVRSAEAQITFPEADFSGYSTGTSVSADTLQATATGPRLASGEVAFSGASVASQGFAGAVLNEMEQTVLPTAFTGKKAAGRGIGFDAGRATNVPGPLAAGQLLLAGLAEAAAPPAGDPVTSEVPRVVSGPLASASLARGQAHTVFGDEVCLLGQPISYGLGYVAGAQLLDGGPAPADGSFPHPLLAAGSGDPGNGVSSGSRSFTYLVPNGDGTFGLVSETRPGASG